MSALASATSDADAPEGAAGALDGGLSGSTGSEAARAEMLALRLRLLGLISLSSDVHMSVVPVMTGWMDAYSASRQREAVGVVLEDSFGKQTWRGLVNAHSKPRHQFAIAEEQIRPLWDAVISAGGRVVAICHSHPFVGPGLRGWAGPSSEDLEQRFASEQEAAGESSWTPSDLPESLVWCPAAGSAGILVGYGGHGNIWYWKAGEGS